MTGLLVLQAHIADNFFSPPTAAWLKPVLAAHADGRFVTGFTRTTTISLPSVPEITLFPLAAVAYATIFFEL